MWWTKIRILFTKFFKNTVEICFQVTYICILPMNLVQQYLNRRVQKIVPQRTFYINIIDFTQLQHIFYQQLCLTRVLCIHTMESRSTTKRDILIQDPIKTVYMNILQHNVLS